MCIVLLPPDVSTHLQLNISYHIISYHYLPLGFYTSIVYEIFFSVVQRISVVTHILGLPEGPVLNGKAV